MIPIGIFWILLIVLFLLPFLLLFKKDKKKMGNKAWILAILRGLSLVLIAFLLYPRQYIKKEYVKQKPQLIILEDESISAKKWSEYSNWVKIIASEEEKWEKDFDIRYFKFASGVDEKDTDQQKDSLYFEATNISNALELIWKKTDLDRIRGIILATDGLFNQGMDPYFLSYPLDLPHLWVGLGDSTSKKDIEISEVSFPRKVTLGQKVKLQSQIIAKEFKDKNTNVQLRINEQKVQEQGVEISSNNHTESVHFEWEPDKAGWYNLQIASPFLSGEFNPDNNQKSFHIEVIEEKLNILIWASAPHPDVQFLKKLEKYIPEATIGLHYGEEKPKDIEKINILLAVNLGTRIPHEFEGIAMHFLGQNSNLPPFISEGVKKLNVPIESEILWKKESENIFRDLIKDIKQQNLPPLQQSFQWNKNFLKEGLDLAESKNNNVFIYLNNNDPKEVYINGLAWWKWNLVENKDRKEEDIRNNPSVTEQLFLQLIRYAQHNLKAKKLDVYPNKSEYYYSDNIELIAQIYDAYYNAREENIIVEIYKDEELLDTYNMQANGDNIWNLNLGHWPAGLYRFNAKMENKSEFNDSGYFEVLPSSLELQNLEADWLQMSQWADISNGDFFAWNEVDKIEKWFDENAISQELRIEKKQGLFLIDKKWWFILILFFLSSEWILRKRWGGYR